MDTESTDTTPEEETAYEQVILEASTYHGDRYLVDTPIDAEQDATVEITDGEPVEGEVTPIAMLKAGINQWKGYRYEEGDTPKPIGAALHLTPRGFVRLLSKMFNQFMNLY